MPSAFTKRLWTILLSRKELLCIIVAVCAGRLSAVDISSPGRVQTVDDTTRPSTSSLTFELLSTRLNDLIKQQADPNSVPEDIIENQVEAQTWAAQGDYEMALTFVENALAYFKPDKTIKPAATTGPEARAWSIDLFTGSDLWQQRFGISLVDSDSSIFESEGNPFIGMRFGYSNQRGSLHPLSTLLESRFSPQYLSGLFELVHSRPVGTSLQASLNNRLERTAYRQQHELSFWQNWCKADLSWQAGKNTRLMVAEDWQIRHYSTSTPYLSSFAQNQIGCRLLQQWNTIRPEFRYDYRVRSYDSSDRMDYAESICTLYVWPDLFQSLQVGGYAQARRRHYSGAFVDSLLNNHFSEFYSQAECKWILHPSWSLKTEVEFTLRRYEHPAIAFPNYADAEIEPSLAWQAGSPWSVRAGYRIRQKSHWFAQGHDDWNAQVENFHSHGPVLSLDLFNAKGLFVSLLDHFEWRRYPQAPSSELALYSDRNINSLFLLAGWSFARHWELTAMATIDHEDDRNLEGADSRSDILNFELYYKF
jgi:hypothetical protein